MQPKPPLHKTFTMVMFYVFHVLGIVILALESIKGVSAIEKYSNPLKQCHMYYNSISKVHSVGATNVILLMYAGIGVVSLVCIGTTITFICYVALAVEHILVPFIHTATLVSSIRRNAHARKL